MLDISIIILFLISNLAIGLYSSKNISNFSEYSVWNRSFGSFAICATLSASFIGGGYIMGNAAKVYDVGMIYAFGLLGFSLKEILIATWVAPRMAQYQHCHSVGDIMQQQGYGKTIKVITGFFSVLICAGILGAQVSAIGVLCSSFLHINPLLGILLGFSIITLYTGLGGMRSVVLADILQFMVLLIGIPLTLIMGLHYIGGWQVIRHSVPAEQINPLLAPYGLWQLLSLMLTFMLGEVLIPPYVQRLFLAKSTQTTYKATLMAGLISMPIFLAAGAIGLIAYCMNNQLEANQAMPYVIAQALPVGAKGLVLASLLAVIMSSAAGFLNAAAIAVTTDIVAPLFPQVDLSHRSTLHLARIVAILVGMGAVVFALMIKNILDILIYAYTLWAPVILIPLLGAIFDKKVSARRFYVSALVGLSTTLIWTFIWHDPLAISSNVIGVLASLAAFLITPAFRDCLIKH